MFSPRSEHGTAYRLFAEDSFFYQMEANGNMGKVSDNRDFNFDFVSLYSFEIVDY